MNSHSIDFCGCHYYGYFDDCFAEYADSNTSIYYNQQRDYYYNHVDECMAALREYDYSLDDLIKQGLDLDEIVCKAGTVGEYKAIYNELCDDKKNIIKVLAIDDIEYFIKSNLDLE